ncbi:hypothetical protein FOA52_014951 [Chlamydomonas sp. UWO 241]|nr:hypothetical protein FOA52_014951 [Chlamydomonas sp. UWO 241]
MGHGTVAVMAAAAAGVGPSDNDGGAGASQKQGQGQAQRRTGALQFGDERRRVTDSLLVINAVCMMLQWLSKGLLTFWGAKVNSYIFEGQWWRLITPTFLHSGLFHLAINCYALNSLGPQVETLTGPRRFAAIYLTSALTGTVASVLMTPQPSLGASGAIFGLGASLALFYWRHKETLGSTSDSMLKQLGITVAINAAYSLAVKNIDNWGHVGGLLGGAAASWLLGPHLIGKRHLTPYP